MIISPYHDRPIKQWRDITKQLIDNYPLDVKEILEIATISWDRMWTSVIGDEIRLSEVDLPSTIIGYFFQRLFAHELLQRYPDEWVGEKHKSDKDLVNLTNPLFSTEMKSSGQLGYKLYGNRSYNQLSQNEELSGKDKSGYYITLNFYKQNMTLLRLGWIDQNDWIPQGSQTGQAATLRSEVYEYKLVPIVGNYIFDTPISLLPDVGAKTSQRLHDEYDIYNFDDLHNYQGNDLNKFKRILKDIYNNYGLSL